MSGKGIYQQAICASCHKYFYRDELRQDASGRLVCYSCYLRQIAAVAKRQRPLKSRIPGGAHLIEILVVVLIIGGLATIMYNTLMPLRQKAKESDLEYLFYANQNTEMGKLAADVISILQKGQSLEELAKIAQLDSETLGQLDPEALSQLDPEVLQQSQSLAEIAKLVPLNPTELARLNDRLLQHQQSLELYAKLAKLDPEERKELDDKLDRQSQLLESTARLTKVDPEEFKELDTELKKYLELDSYPQQVGAAIKAIEEWQQSIESR